jgi:hypothetical protein
MQCCNGRFCFTQLLVEKYITTRYPRAYLGCCSTDMPVWGCGAWPPHTTRHTCFHHQRPEAGVWSPGPGVQKAQGGAGFYITARYAVCAGAYLPGPCGRAFPPFPFPPPPSSHIYFHYPYAKSVRACPARQNHSHSRPNRVDIASRGPLVPALAIQPLELLRCLLWPKTKQAVRARLFWGP